MDLTEIISDYDKVFVPNSDVYTREGKKSLLQFQDKPKSEDDEPGKHVVVMPPSTFDELYSIASRKNDNPEGKSALEVLRFVRKTLQQNPGKEILEIGGNLDLYVPVEDKSFQETLREVKGILDKLDEEKSAYDVRVISNREDLLARSARSGLVCEKSKFDKTDPSLIREGMIEVDNNYLLEDLMKHERIPIDEVSDALKKDFFIYDETIREAGKKYLYPNQIVEFMQEGNGGTRTYAIVEGTKTLKKDTHEVLSLDNVVLRLISRSELAKIKGHSYVGVVPKNDEQAFAAKMIADPEINLVFLIGGAGTGKTVITYAAGLSQVLHFGGKTNNFRQLAIAKSVRAVPGENMGYKPGNMLAKATGTLASFSDAHNVTGIGGDLNRMMARPDMEYEGLAERKDDKTTAPGGGTLPKNNAAVEFVPFEHIRGRSIPNALIYVDEVQNIDPATTKTIISRAGKASKTIISGDIYQIDNNALEVNYNGLLRAIEHFHGHPSVALIRLQTVMRPIQAQLADSMPTW